MLLQVPHEPSAMFSADGAPQVNCEGNLASNYRGCVTRNLSVKVLLHSFLFYRQVLEDMEMLSAFTAVLHVPNLSQPEHILSVLEQESDVFSKSDLSTIYKRMKGHK